MADELGMDVEMLFDEDVQNCCDDDDDDDDDDNDDDDDDDDDDHDDHDDDHDHDHDDNDDDDDDDEEEEECPNLIAVKDMIQCVRYAAYCSARVSILFLFRAYTGSTNGWQERRKGIKVRIASPKKDALN